MAISSLKVVSISCRGYKKQLLIPPKEVSPFVVFLKSVIKEEVMAMSTNLGLDIYYRSPVNQLQIIQNTFLLLMIPSNKTVEDFHFNCFEDTKDIVLETQRIFIRLSEMPLLLKSYSKSLLYQMEKNYDVNNAIVPELFSMWQEALLSLDYGDPQNIKLKYFLSNLQKTYIRNSCHPDFKGLLEDVLSPLHEN